MSEDAARPIVGAYDNGPVKISWSIDGDGYTRCELVLLFNGDVIDENTLHPDDVNWNTGKHEASDGWVDLDLRMTVPTDDQKGALRIVKLEYEQEDQGPQVVENTELVTWTPSGQ
jgi:hypothetical protein